MDVDDDSKIGASPLDGGFGAGIKLRSFEYRAQSSYWLWPEDRQAGDELLEHLSLVLRDVAWFITSRLDLCDLLPTDSREVIRDSTQLFASFPMSYPGRLISALLLARELNYRRVEHKVLDRMHSDTRDYTDSGAFQKPLTAAVAQLLGGANKRYGAMIPLDAQL